MIVHVFKVEVNIDLLSLRYGTKAPSSRLSLTDTGPNAGLRQEQAAHGDDVNYYAPTNRGNAMFCALGVQWKI